MTLPFCASGRVLALSGILVFFLFGSFGISLAHDPAATLAPLQIVQLSRVVLLVKAQPDGYSLGPAIVAEATGVQNPLDASPERVKYLPVEPGGRAATLFPAAPRTAKASLQIINSALQI